MAWRRPGDKPLSEPMIVVLPTNICVTRPQWVKGIGISFSTSLPMSKTSWIAIKKLILWRKDIILTYCDQIHNISTVIISLKINIINKRIDHIIWKKKTLTCHRKRIAVLLIFPTEQHSTFVPPPTPEIKDKNITRYCTLFISLGQFSLNYSQQIWKVYTAHFHDNTVNLLQKTSL